MLSSRYLGKSLLSAQSMNVSICQHLTTLRLWNAYFQRVCRAVLLYADTILTLQHSDFCGIGPCASQKAVQALLVCMHTLKCTLGWKIFVLKRTAGATRGYCCGTLSTTSNTPPSKGVSFGPCGKYCIDSGLYTSCQRLCTDT